MKAASMISSLVKVSSNVFMLDESASSSYNSRDLNVFCLKRSLPVNSGLHLISVNFSSSKLPHISFIPRFVNAQSEKINGNTIIKKILLRLDKNNLVTHLSMTVASMPYIQRWRRKEYYQSEHCVQGIVELAESSFSSSQYGLNHEPVEGLGAHTAPQFSSVSHSRSRCNPLHYSLNLHFRLRWCTPISLLVHFLQRLATEKRNNKLLYMWRKSVIKNLKDDQFKESYVSK